MLGADYPVEFLLVPFTPLGNSWRNFIVNIAKLSKVNCQGPSEVEVRNRTHLPRLKQSKDGIIRGKPRDMRFGLQSLELADEPLKQGTYRTDICPHPIFTCHGSQNNLSVVMKNYEIVMKTHESGWYNEGR